ncbi:hypothetical protein ACFC0R_42025, partial [Streptomyces sp. NPDC056086]|uniref:hypothetical protein n=1 Tax=Streptomyces sp. NPDC056086 TaxID=3345709 RepID=UPI0035D93D45
GAATIKPSRKPVTSGDTFSRTSHDRNYSCGDSSQPRRPVRRAGRPYLAGRGIVKQAIACIKIRLADTRIR